MSLKKIAVVITVSVVLVCGFLAVSANLQRTTKETPATLTALLQEVADDKITIAGVGDMMLGTNYPAESYLPPNDGRDLLSQVAATIQSADIAFGNCEGTFLDSGGDVKQCEDPTKCYAFRQPIRYASYLAAAGFDLISIANNHSGDFGSVGRSSTIKALTENGMFVAGLEQTPTTVIEKNGIRYGLAAFAPNSGTADIRQISKASEIVRNLAKQCDIVIVSFHGGAEGPDHQHVSKKGETFYGENRGNVYEFSHAMIDAGADIIFGHGPHVTRAFELYKDRLIAYSLGNFCTYARFNLNGPNGLAPLLLAEVNREGKFLGGSIIPIKQEGEGGPQLDTEKKVITKIIELTKSDFPETRLSISEEGVITPVTAR